MNHALRLRTEEIAVIGVLAFLVLGAYGVASSDILAAGNPTGDLVAHYRFAEEAGDTAYDATDNGYDATLQHFDYNGTSGWRDTAKGGAVEFDGANDSATNQNVDLSSVGENESFAISGWFKTASTDDQVLFGMTDEAFATGSDSNAYIILGNGTLNWVIEPGFRQGGHYIAGTGKAFNDGDWHHVYAEREEYTWNIYVDGKRRSSEVNKTFNEALRSDADFDLGAYRDIEHYFDGRIAEARLWTTNLSDSAITDNVLTTSKNNTRIIKTGYQENLYKLEPRVEDEREWATETRTVPATKTGMGMATRMVPATVTWRTATRTRTG